MNGWIDALNGTADGWAHWMFHMSWQIAIVVAAVWLVSRIASKRSARFRHLLWVAVFLKLVLPPMLATPWSVGNLLAEIPDAYVPSAIQDAGFMAKDRASEAEPSATPAMAMRSTTGPEFLADTTSEIASPAHTSSLSIPAWCMAVWAFIALGLAAAVGWQYCRFVRLVLRHATAAPETLQAVVNAQADQLGVSRNVPILVSPAIHTPAVFGFLRPSIVLPADWDEQFTAGDLAGILAHEVAHIKRGDLPVTVIAAMLSCVYWFHPAVWFANLQQRREREMACDDVVLESSRQPGKAYAATLLRAAEQFTGETPVGAGFLGLMELSDNLLHRVRAATDAGRARRMGWGSAVVLIAGLLVLPMGVWNASGQTAEEAVSAVEAEIAAHYAKADPEVQEYVRWTAKQFSRGGLWLPENAFDDLTPEQREEKVNYYVKALEGEYGRHQCEALASAGVLKDARLLSGVLKAATYHRNDSDYDCRPKWMAVEALGRLGDESVVPALVPLVDHGNQNTRMWARASLVRLTGQNFKDDKQAWGSWWNNAPKEPRINLSELKPWTPPAGVPTSEAQPTGTAPEIVSVSPAIGAQEVDPATTEIRVTFDQDMMMGGYSWTGGGEMFPKTTGKPEWIDNRTCVLHIALEPAKVYRVGINSKSHNNFRGVNGIPARPRAVYFATIGADPAEVAKLVPPAIVSMTPENGASGVPASTAALTVVFDKPMGGGFSWVTLDENYPETTGGPSWNDDHTVCTLPVSLKPNASYHVSLNSGRHINFQSASGVPLEPIDWTFSTGQ
jgi:beta-lactamase regulating signal transducer with metallopeptidase domain